MEAVKGAKGGSPYLVDSGFSQVVVALLGLALLTLFLKQPISPHRPPYLLTPLSHLRAGPLFPRYLAWSIIILDMSSFSIAHSISDNLAGGWGVRR